MLFLLAYLYLDPTGFTGILNEERAKYGLCNVIYDPLAAQWASENNKIMSGLRYSGHFINPNGYYWQVAWAVNGNIYQALNAWMNSTSHRNALLNPDLRTIGYCNSYGVITANGKDKDHR